MLDNIVICRKLAVLISYYKELQELTGNLTLDEYLNTLQAKRAIEREIQLIVECATDINNMILKKLKQGPSQDYFNSFINLAENNIIPMDFALIIAPSTGLRNILVHEYQQVDDKIIYHSITKVLNSYREYIKLISDYLDCGV